MINGSNDGAFQRFLSMREKQANGADNNVVPYILDDTTGISGTECQLITFDALGVLLQSTVNTNVVCFFPWGALQGIALA